MTFTTAEKLQIAMLCDLAKPAKDRDLDFEFIGDAVRNGDAWALARRYSGLQLNVATPPEVDLVSDVLDMWARIEKDFGALTDAEKARVVTDSHHYGEPKFNGFDGNNETELLHIALLLVDKLDLWSDFKGRDLKGAVTAADPIFILSGNQNPEISGRLEFEVLDENKSYLDDLIGQREHYAIGAEWAFWAVLNTLEPCISIHDGLALLRGRKCWRGVMEVFREAPLLQ